MAQTECLVQVAQLLEADTWVAQFVKLIASASVHDGHAKFAADPSGFERMAEEAVENFRFQIKDAIRLAAMYPDLFKDPTKTSIDLEHE